FDIHGWTGKDAVTGHFKFLTCSIISDDIPEKIPLISVPIRLGHYKSSVILYCLYLIKDYIGKINLILFDRGFFDKDLMFELTKLNYPYLIFVPKHKDKKEILYPMKIGEQVAIYNEFKVNKNQSKYAGENILIFLKQIYDPRSEKNYDWVFATNVEEVLLNNLVITYKKRWRIETQFRVQDEARIKCKSKEMKVRYFFFLFEQMLQTIWMCFYKDEASFKEFLIEMNKVSKRYTNTQE
ncbi:MAG: transposase, partial [Candidatus Woesebacteria bacterium]|nr:transposase [Candidatus Woesebacteria bacterium]